LLIQEKLFLLSLSCCWFRALSARAGVLGAVHEPVLLCLRGVLRVVRFSGLGLRFIRSVSDFLLSRCRVLQTSVPSSRSRVVCLCSTLTHLVLSI